MARNLADLGLSDTLLEYLAAAGASSARIFGSILQSWRPPVESLNRT
jgi:hypothetical protein